MNAPEVLYKLVERAGEAFQPSNGTEGMIFMEAFCSNCIHDNEQNEKYCELILYSMSCSPGDKDYPKEWIYNELGWPVCTKWHKWDWDNDGDPDDLDNPKAPTPYDPNQLVMFSVADDTLRSHKPKEHIPKVIIHS